MGQTTWHVSGNSSGASGGTVKDYRSEYEKNKSAVDEWLNKNSEALTSLGYNWDDDYAKWKLYTQKDSLQSKFDEYNNLQENAKTAASDTAEAAAQSISEEQSKASSNLGLTSQRAAALAASGESRDYNNIYGNQYSSNKNIQAQTQADWLQKLGYSNALSQQSSNIANSAGLASLAAFFGGAGSGMQAGMNGYNSFARS